MNERKYDWPCRHQAGAACAACYVELVTEAERLSLELAIARAEVTMLRAERDLLLGEVDNRIAKGFKLWQPGKNREGD